MSIYAKLEIVRASDISRPSIKVNVPALHSNGVRHDRNYTDKQTEEILEKLWTFISFSIMGWRIYELTGKCKKYKINYHI